MTAGWRRGTRDNWFYGTLLASALAVVWLFWPFFSVLLYAAVVAVVAEPLHTRLTYRLGGRRLLAATLTALAFGLLVLLPLGFVIVGFARQGIGFASHGLDWVAEGHLQTAVEAAQRDLGDRLVAWTGSEDSRRMVVLPNLSDTLQQAVTRLLSLTGDVLPGILSGMVTAVIGGIIFILTVITLLAEGPRLTEFVTSLTPLEDRYELHLIAVFRELAFNMVVGIFVVALAQGVAATLGYYLLDVPRPLFFGMLTGLGSFLPIVGTGIVAVPMIVWTFVTHGPGAGLALLLWSVLVVGTVDNLLRPLIIRGNADIHPLLVFLAVFGGLWWMGLPGALVGPVLVAMFLALARIYRAEFLGKERPLDD